ncbi:MAG: acyl-ACP--UDP-N-acetylglucosamine O-acyltransferase [Epsilonproteobacteria bacterium]|nr:acyl-ACP--UDP-N-acetylglucosamine O-acyltransferase [Campylobacterota bacterium]
MSKIANSAIIEKGAVIGEDVEIGDFAFVGSQAKLANGVKVFQGAQVRGETDIGENSQIHSYAVVGNFPQDVSYKGVCGKLIIGKNNIIREYVTINLPTLKQDKVTLLGDNNYIMAYCHIAHDCVIGNNVILANAATLAGHVEIGDFTVVGGLTPIHQFVKIGESVMIGGASAVSQDIPPYCLAEGNRAKIKGLNLVGLRRRFERDDINELKKAYNAIFRSNKPIKESVEEVLKSSDNDKVRKLCEFIKDTKRGIPFDRHS